MMHAIREHLHCPICTCTMSGRIYQVSNTKAEVRSSCPRKNLTPKHPPQCEEGHTICEKCFGKIERCPSCRSRKLSVRNRALEALVSELNVRCAYQVAGCKFKGESSEMRVHKQTCAYRPIKCPFGCGHQCVKEQLVEHLIKHHHGRIGSFQKLPLKRPPEGSKSHWYPPLITQSDDGAQVMTCAHIDSHDNMKIKFLSISVKPQADKSGCGAPSVQVKLYPYGKLQPVWSICNTAMHLRGTRGKDRGLDSYVSLLSVPQRILSSYHHTAACMEVIVENS